MTSSLPSGAQLLTLFLLKPQSVNRTTLHHTGFVSADFIRATSR